MQHNYSEQLSNSPVKEVSNSPVKKIVEPFIRLPNHIITHSLLHDKNIIPFYLYSAVHCNPNYYNIVDTNLSLISETFLPSNPSAPAKFEKTFFCLSSDIVNPSATNTITTTPSLANTSQYNSSNLLQDFSSPFKVITPAIQNSASINKTTRLQYIFLDRYEKTDNKWTKFTLQEYFYITDCIPALNQKYNIVELLNLYAYFKQRILFYSYVQPKQFYTTPSMHESIDTICQATNLARNTFTKYSNQLEELKLINIKKGNFNNYKNKKACNEYSLSALWKEDYES